MNGTTKLTPAAASYVLYTLVSNREVRRSQIDRALKQRDQEVEQLRQRIAELEEIGDTGRRPVHRRANGADVPTRRIPKEKRLQGAYLGYVRHLSERDKVRVKALRQSRGLESAVKLAMRLGQRG